MSAIVNHRLLMIGGSSFTGTLAGNLTFGTSASVLNGTTGSIGLYATGTNQSITLTPTGTGQINVTKASTGPAMNITNTGLGEVLTITRGNAGAQDAMLRIYAINGTTSLFSVSRDGSVDGANGLGFNSYNGSASSPSYRFGTDSNTGIYTTGANSKVIAFSNNGVQSANLGATGNLTLAFAYIGSTSTLSGAGAANVTTETTKITTTGAGNAITLADGVDGQHKYVIHDVDGGSFDLAPTTRNGWANYNSTAAGQSVHLLFVTTRGWTIVGNNGGTIT